VCNGSYTIKVEEWMLETEDLAAEKEHLMHPEGH